MSTALGGIHHVTALAADPQRNIDFYAGVLGLRLVKLTVNFDAPDVYHIYYGNDTGDPGTILTFFPFPDASRGKRGTGEISAVAFLAPRGSLEFWAAHLSQHGIRFDGPFPRFGEQCVSFEDPDGMTLELVFGGGGERDGGERGESPVPRASALQRIRGVTILLRDSVRTDEVLTATLGLRRAESESGRVRYLIGKQETESTVDIMTEPSIPRAAQSAGSVHHIAWRTPSGEEQLRWRERIREAGMFVTEVLDRSYFQSIYFREPGGVLFEIATDPPGFAVDESPEELGSHLKLPPWLEPERLKIERLLPPVSLPGARRHGIPQVSPPAPRSGT
jgi:glyoxalase family protein